MFNKKIRKLIKNPKLFFSDMNLKRSKKINSLKPKKNIGSNNFTVVSAVYNVGKYLDKYFDSLVNQRLDFENNIHLILVDDGSPDDSGRIIKKWQSKYPNNITYVKKENGGQASARNYGLQFVKTEWVTFIDPDDFVDINYFLAIENFINKNKNNSIGLLCCNFIFYFEDLDQFKDTHPLKYRFTKGDRLSDVTGLNKDVQLSVNSAIFKTEVINKNSVLFGEDIKPNFEDAHFVATYLMYLSQEKVAFLKTAQYFYRKRSDGSSTLDKAWEKTSLYNVVLEKGCLDLLRRYKNEKGIVPEFVQITNLYHLIWYFKKLINNSHKLNFLSKQEKIEFNELVNEIFEYIDVKTIMEFSLADCWFFHKVGLLGLFKNQEPVNQIIYIDSYDRVKDITQLRLFSYNTPDIQIQSGQDFILPYYEKEIQHEFVDRVFVREFRFWVKINPKSKLKITINNKPAVVTCGGKQHKEGITGQEIRNYFHGLIPGYVVKNEHSDAWVFMDRDFQADDNAEHLYRYVMRKHQDRNIYFALNRDSHDWERLENEGFRMLAFGSELHHEILKSCSKVISSNADHCVVNLLGLRMLSGRHFVFLQHGVIHNDLSAWLNSKENIDCFVTSSPFEYQSIAGDSNKYKYSNKEVVLTGLPRHDYLIRNNTKPENVILVMPTWRTDIVGKSDLGGHSRSVNHDFLETNFAKSWMSLFQSSAFQAVLEKYNYKVVIYPHPNLIPYINYFQVSDNIEILMPENVRIQEIFRRSALLLTDYTSVAFDMAVQNKATVYYQFDEHEVLHSGNHTFGPGYFKHRRDGFGPVCNTEEEVIYSLDKLLGNACTLETELSERIAKTFPLRDGRCCERTFNAIVALDSPELPEIEADRLIQQAKRMIRDQNWSAAESWWKSLAQREDVWLKQEWYVPLLEETCLNLLEEHLDSEGKVPEKIQETVLHHLFLYIRKLMDNAYLLNWMGENGQEDFLNLMDTIFSYIEDKTILKFSREGSWFLHKIGMLNAFKNNQPDCQYVYVDSYDRIKGLVQLRYFIRGDESGVFQVGEKYSLPVYEKVMRHDILDRDFILEKRVWLSIKPKDKLIVTVSNLPTILSYGGKQYKEGVTGQSIISYFNGMMPKYVINNEHSNAWVFMDQVSQADDNAEYFYRYVMQQYPGKNIYFALSSDSHDWERLENEGFHLLPFGSKEHLDVLKSCSKVISSQSENYVVNFIGPKMLFGRHFIYLQSGVSCNDKSSFLNIKDNIDCLITSTHQEYISISGDNNKYKYSSKEVCLTGLPRFDSLLNSKNDTKNIILIMPSLIHNDMIRLNKWNELFSSDLWAEMLNNSGYKAMLYVPEDFPMPGFYENIEVLTSCNVGFRDILRKAKLLLTDYSSATFDMAIQNKCTVYYHFNDENTVEHTSSEYFNYHRDGFGPVCKDAFDVLEQISILLKNDCCPDKRILDLINQTFVYRDGKCCERIFTAVELLDSGDIPEVSIDDMIFHATQVIDSSDWKLAVRWWKTISQDIRCWDSNDFYTRLLKFSCLNLLKHASSQNLNIPIEFQNSVLQHLFLYFKKLIDRPNENSCLKDIDIEMCWNTISDITQFLDDTAIMKFSHPGYWFLHKAGILGTLKRRTLESQIVYVEKIDKVKGLIQLRYFTCDDEPLLVQIDNEYSCALYSKNMYHDFLGHRFITERREWHKLDMKGTICICFSNIQTSISLGGKSHRGKISAKVIYDYFSSLLPEYFMGACHDDIWMFMDRNIQAGDNAEHLYRYVMNNFPSKNIYFALNQESSDWERLEQEGFKLVAFGCNKHKDLLKICSKVISSQIDDYVTNLLGPKMLLGRHFVYLQHGINQYNSFNELNNKDTIDCFITSTSSEHQSIIDNSSMYKYSSKEVKLTGMPRFDSLTFLGNEVENFLLIIPNVLQKHNYELNENWNDTLTSYRLKELVDTYGYKIVCYTNSIINLKDELLSYLSHIEFLNATTSNVQELIKKSKLLLTDCNEFSVDMAIQNKPVIYFNHDDNICSDNTNYICKKTSELLILIENIFIQGYEPQQDLFGMTDSGLDIRDGRCCERVFFAINELDNPLTNIPVSYLTRVDDALWYGRKEQWEIAAKIWRSILNDDDRLDYRIKYIESLLACGNIVGAASIAERMVEHELSLCSDEQKSIISFMYFLLGEYDKTISVLNMSSNNELPYYYKIALWILGESAPVVFNKDDLDVGEFYLYIRTLIDNKDYEMALAIIKDREADVALCNSLIIDTLFAGKRYSELLIQLSGYSVFDINSELAMKYFSAALNKGLYSEIISYDSVLSSPYVISGVKEYTEVNDIVKNIFAESYFYIKEWSSAIYHFSKIKDRDLFSLYKLAYSYRMLGDIEKASSLLEDSYQAENARGFSLDSWLLIIELAQISGNWDKVVYGWSNIIRYYSDTLPDDAWLHYKNAQMRLKLDESSLSDAEKALLLVSFGSAIH